MNDSDKVFVIFIVGFFLTICTCFAYGCLYGYLKYEMILNSSDPLKTACSFDIVGSKEVSILCIRYLESNSERM